MRRRVAFLALLGACSSPQTKPPDRAIPAMTRSLGSKLGEQLRGMTAKPKIAVFPFTDDQGRTSAFGRYLAEKVVTDLGQQQGFELIERSRLEDVMRELKLTTSGLVSDATAKSVGNLLGADAIVIGTFLALATRVDVNCRIVDPESGKILATTGLEVDRSADIDELLAMGEAAPPAAPAAASVAPAPVAPVVVSAGGDNLIGVGTDGKLYQKTAGDLTSLWGDGPIPNSCCVKDAIIGPDGKILGVGMSNEIWRKTTADPSSPWEAAPIPGTCCVTKILMHPDGDVLGVGLDHFVWKRSLAPGGEWKQLPNTCCVSAIQLDAQGVLHGVGMDNFIWRKATSDMNGEWKQIPASCCVKDLLFTPDGFLLGVGMNDRIYKKNTKSPTSDWGDGPLPNSCCVVGLELPSKR